MGAGRHVTADAPQVADPPTPFGSLRSTLDESRTSGIGRGRHYAIDRDFRSTAVGRVGSARVLHGRAPRSTARHRISHWRNRIRTGHLRTCHLPYLTLPYHTIPSLPFPYLPFPSLTSPHLPSPSLPFDLTSPYLQRDLLLPYLPFRGDNFVGVFLCFKLPSIAYQSVSDLA